LAAPDQVDGGSHEDFPDTRSVWRWHSRGAAKNPDRRAILVHKAPLVLKEHKASRASPDRKAKLARKGLRVHRARRATRATPDKAVLFDRCRRTVLSVVMPMKHWCRCSVPPVALPMEQNAARLRPLACA